MELTINGKFTREGQHYKDKNFNMIPIKKKKTVGALPQGSQLQSCVNFQKCYQNSTVSTL